MSDTMSQADLIEDLQSLLMDASKKFIAKDGNDFIRHLDIAARDMARVRRRTLVGTLALVADQPNYPAPTDILDVKLSIWGRTESQNRKPWESNWPGNLPRMSLTGDEANREIWLSPSPSAAQITDLGSTYRFFYFATHQISTDETKTTINSIDRPLLLIRAAAQSLQELAHDNFSKPVQLGGAGIGSMPKNGTPAALSNALLDLFERMAAA